MQNVNKYPMLRVPHPYCAQYIRIPKLLKHRQETGSPSAKLESLSTEAKKVCFLIDAGHSLEL